MIDLAALEAEFSDLQTRYRAWNKPIYETWEALRREVQKHGYPQFLADEEVEALYHQQLARYNPYQAEVPARERLLAAASLENCAHDFRDFDALLAYLAIAARESGVDIEPHAQAAAALCDDQPTRGGCFPSVQARIAGFHIYARTAKSLFGDDD